MRVRHKTIIDALLAHARERPDETYASFDRLDTSEPESWTYAQTLDNARSAAGALAVHGVGPGDRLVIVGGNDARTLALLLGAFGSGVAPAVVHPPLRADVGAARAQLTAVVRRAEPALVVAPSAMHAAFPQSARVESARSVLQAGAQPRELRAQDPSETGYLQFSSGTTGAQKAVMVPAGAIAANAEATIATADIAGEQTWVIWLPLYHDMGLMSGALFPLYGGQRTVLLPPERFVERPLSWLCAVTRYRGTVTVAPNFAYALAARRAKPERLQELDLSSLRIAFNGAEMVSADAVRRFEKVFAPAGLAPNTVYPVYGLAEFTLAAVFWRAGEAIRVDQVSRKALGQGSAEPTGDGPGTSSFVSVGRAITEHQMRVVGADGSVCPERQVGELQLRGPSRAAGYLADPQQTAAMRDGEWLRTGDMAYVANDDLFICGRKKDIIIRYGENFFPQDLEVAAGSTPGLKPGRLAVIGVEDSAMATERVWLAFECSETGDAAYELAQAARAKVIEAAGFKLDGVSAVPPGWVEKTSSGKIRRFVLRGKLAAMFAGGDPPPSVGRWPDSPG